MGELSEEIWAARTKLSEPFTRQLRLLMTLNQRPFENIVGKGENAGNQHFLLFPQCFLTFVT